MRSPIKRLQGLANIPVYTHLTYAMMITIFYFLSSVKQLELAVLCNIPFVKCLRLGWLNPWDGFTTDVIHHPPTQLLQKRHLASDKPGNQVIVVMERCRQWQKFGLLQHKNPTILSETKFNDYFSFPQNLVCFKDLHLSHPLRNPKQCWSSYP